MVSEPTLGAWVFGPYRYIRSDKMGVLPADPTIDQIRVNCAVKSIQIRLKTVGFDPHRRDGVFGWWTWWAVRQFQKKQGMKLDGEVGRKTMGELWRARIEKEAVYTDVPKHLAVGVIIHESGFDPAAVGASTPPELGVDRGLVQINSLSHPDVSDKSAYDFLFSLKWENDRLAALGWKYRTKPELQWLCAVAANKSPVAAATWFENGTPPNPEIEKFANEVVAYGLAYWA